MSGYETAALNRAPRSAPGVASARMGGVRVATFNVNFRGMAAAQRLGGLVGRHGVDLLLLQEANPSSLRELVDAAGLDWVISAYDAGAPRPASRGRARVAAIAGRGSAPSKMGDRLTDRPPTGRLVPCSARRQLGARQG